MPEKADIPRSFGLFFIGLVVGFFAAQALQRTIQPDVTDYQQKARDARRTADALRWEMNARGGNHGQYSQEL